MWLSSSTLRLFACSVIILIYDCNWNIVFYPMCFLYMVDVILVDEHDVPIWRCEKYKAHQEWGHLHRAFSVYVINEKKEVLLQQRAFHKYHSPWVRANTCCSHQLVWEKNDHAAHRRSQEEMWFDANLFKITEFVYKAPVPPWLTEYEYLHLYFGIYEGQKITPNPDEVAAWERVSFEDMDRRVQEKDVTLAPWTQVTWRKCSDMFEEFYQEKFWNEIH